MNQTTPERDISEEERDRLVRSLERVVRGEIRFDTGSRSLYATDGSNYRQVPIGVVVPRDLDDVVATFRVAAEHGVPVLSRGGGTSLAGQCCNTAVVLDCSKYLHGVESIDVENRTATVLPGTNLDTLRRAAEKHGLTFGPDPSTHTHCTLGGMIGNNSCGVHAVLSEFYGKGPRTEDNLLQMEVLTYDGERMVVGATSEEELEAIIAEGGRRGRIYESLRNLRDRHHDAIVRDFPNIPRRVSGYNLPALLPEHGFNLAHALVGSEGTCVFVPRATVHLVDHKPKRVLAVLGYPSVFRAGDDIDLIRQFAPIGCEGIDQKLVDFMREKHLNVGDLEYLPEGNGWLLVEFGADDEDDAAKQAERFVKYAEKHGRCISAKVYRDPAAQAELWEARESGLGATAYVPGRPDTWPGWEDAAVPPARVGEYLRRFEALLDSYGYDAALYGHFAQGCIHCRIDFDLKSEEGVGTYQEFTRAAADLVVELGGSISGEHGDGQARGDLLPRMFGAQVMEAFREFKHIFDPRLKMNPGKVIDAFPRTTNLRMGPDYEHRKPQTHFHFAEDGGSFAHAASRCAGVGTCRRNDGGTMCPSFMVTKEEKHSTRGRARLLFEMMVGTPLEGGFRNEEVKESLDLCLACKGCTSECPVTVDMPTYKAEFLSHYYEGRLRPREQYAFGWIHRWVRLAALAPGLVNSLAHAPGVAPLFKWAANMAPDRRVPPFAPQTFRAWFSGHEPRNPNGDRVWLWVDTFNNHFHPETLVAATKVLEDAGHRVAIFEKKLCCGRALYDYGMLEEAKKLWRDILEETHASGDEPIIGVEPSCVAAFRDELLKLVRDQEAARALSARVRTLNEFLADKGEYTPPHIEGQAIYQAHCHQKAILDIEADRTLLKRAGLDLDEPNDSCCGMAGSFGFEKDKYGVSQDVGKRKLYPALDARPSLSHIADGFSCREQIHHHTGHLPLHSAEVLAYGRLSRAEAAKMRSSAPVLRVAALLAVMLGVLWFSLFDRLF